MEKESHQCPVCKLSYPTKELSDRCAAWCTDHRSCNLDIIQYAIKETEK